MKIVLFLMMCFGCLAYEDIVISRVFKVYDGDTIFVDIDSFPGISGKNIGIRISGIDTPEMRGGTKESKKKAREARDYLDIVIEYFMSEGWALEVHNPSRGKYFRIVGDLVLVNPERNQIADLKYIMINSGHAVPYDGGKK